MGKISQLIDFGVKIVAAFLIAAMVILVFLQVWFRYVLDAPLDWSEEVATFAFAWMALLGASIGLKRDEHPRLDIILIRLPNFLQKVVRLIIHLSIMFMRVVLIIYGLNLTIVMKMQKTAALGYSMSFVYAVLPLSAFIMLVHSTTQTIGLFKNTIEE